MLRNVTVLTTARSGSGKSTLAAGLACAFALRGERVLVMDLNPLIGGVVPVLDFPDSAPFHLGDAAHDRCGIQDVPVRTGYACEGQLYLACAPVDPQDLPDEVQMQIWLQYASRKFDRVLLDLPWYSSSFISAVRHAAHTLVVTQTDPRSVSCCDRLRTSVRLREAQEPRLLINRFHRRRFQKKSVFPDLDAVIDSCGLQLHGVVPEDDMLQKDLPEVMRMTLHYRRIPYRQKEYAGAIALHYIAERMRGEITGLSPLEEL